MSNRILLAEDDARLRQLFTNLLSHHGYEVSQAASCSETLLYLQAQQYDMLIFDVELEDGNALDVIEDSIQQRNNVIVISSNEAYQTPCRELGVSMFVQKPILPNEFLALVQHALDK